MVKIQVKIPKEVYKKFQLLAIYEGMNHSQLLEKILSEYTEKQYILIKKNV